MNERDLEMAEQFQADQLARSIRNASVATPLPETGHCYNCEDEVGAGKRFCDAYCTEDYENRKKMEKRAPYVSPTVFF